MHLDHARSAPLAVLLPVAAGLLAGCGSSSPSSGVAGAPRKASYAQLVKFSECMRTHGVPTFPDPTQSGGRVGLFVQDRAGSSVSPKSPAFQSAQNACKSYLPNAGQPGQPL